MFQTVNEIASMETNIVSLNEVEILHKFNFASFTDNQYALTKRDNKRNVFSQKYVFKEYQEKSLEEIKMLMCFKKVQSTD